MPLRWSVSGAVLQSVLSETKLVLVAERHGSPVGIGAVDYDFSGEAGLVLLIVDPAHQKTGIGASLLRSLEERLRSLQVRVLRLGAVSTATYLWPGLPSEMEAAWPFFERRGWMLEEACADLVQDLAGFTPPEWIHESLAGSRVVLQLANPAGRSSVAAFEAANFPAWAEYFNGDERLPDGDGRILVAQSCDGEILGTLLMDAKIPRRWSADDNLRVGSINALGVLPSRQRQGIGLALAAKAMEVLRDRGCSKAYIQWTGLTAWYGKLGTSVWARYYMAKKPL
ncbi:MAG: GNAT family N-acetyltransferase [Janthinobacterium lividum]